MNNPLDLSTCFSQDFLSMDEAVLNNFEEDYADEDFCVKSNDSESERIDPFFGSSPSLSGSDETESYKEWIDVLPVEK